jgi:hypothetical protein
MQLQFQACTGAAYVASAVDRHHGLQTLLLLAMPAGSIQPAALAVGGGRKQRQRHAAAHGQSHLLAGAAAGGMKPLHKIVMKGRWAMAAHHACVKLAPYTLLQMQLQKALARCEYIDSDIDMQQLMDSYAYRLELLPVGS